MTKAERGALQALVGRRTAPRASMDDLQGLLLQIVFALLMVFMIAYFMFVRSTRREQTENVLELTRQKLVVAAEKADEDYRIRYGLNALMTQGVDGNRTFEPDVFVRKGRLDLSPAARTAFSVGSKAAAGDYAEDARLGAEWRTRVFASSGVDETNLDSETRTWLEALLQEKREGVRRDVRGVQRSLAARLQRGWIEHPEAIENAKLAAAVRKLDGASAENAASLAADLSDLLRQCSLEALAMEMGAPTLP